MVSVEKVVSNGKVISEENLVNVKNVDPVVSMDMVGMTMEPVVSMDLVEKVISEDNHRSGRWTDHEHLNFLIGLRRDGHGQWAAISKYIPTR
jgi:hypothetical protein